MNSTLHKYNEFFSCTFLKSTTFILILVVSSLKITAQTGQRIQHTLQISTADNSSLLTGVTAIYANPAAAVDQDEIWAFAISANNRFSSDIKSISAAVNHHFGQSSLGLSIGQYGITDFNQSQVSLSFGRSIGKRSYIGLMGHFYQLQIEGLGQRGDMDLSLGFWHNVDNRWTISGYVKNPLGKLQNKDRVLGKAELSIALMVSDKLDLFAGYDYSWQDEHAIRPGLRYSPSKHFSFYVATNTSPESMSFGTDLNFSNGLSTSLGMNTHPILGNSLSFTLNYGI